MATQIQTVNKIQAGLCPHGLPPAACPICSQSMGGGSIRSDKPRRAGEMTYHECAMIGNMMRARELAKKEHEQTLKLNLLNAQNFEKGLEKAGLNIKNLSIILNKNFITKPIAILLNVVALPVLQAVQGLPKFLQNFNNFRFDISDKLNAIYGELKGFIEKKISDFVSVLKENFPTLFKIFKKKNADDEDTKIDDDKKIFNLKNIIKKIFKKKDEKHDHNHKNKK